MVELLQFLQENREGDLLPWLVQVGAAKCYNLSLADVESAALDLGILPSRYQRPHHSDSARQQRTLFRCCVAVIGCGRLGSHVVEQLARLGVGTLIAIDPDDVTGANLHRRPARHCQNSNQSKVEATVHRVDDINPAVSVIPYQKKLTRKNGQHLLRGADCVVDCVDTIHGCIGLATLCVNLNTPLVYGTISGWAGEIYTLLPCELALEPYRRHRVSGHSLLTSAAIGTLEVAEACKTLLDLPQVVNR